MGGRQERTVTDALPGGVLSEPARILAVADDVEAHGDGRGTPARGGGVPAAGLSSTFIYLAGFLLTLSCACPVTVTTKTGWAYLGPPFCAVLARPIGGYAGRDVTVNSKVLVYLTLDRTHHRCTLSDKYGCTVCLHGSIKYLSNLLRDSCPQYACRRRNAPAPMLQSYISSRFFTFALQRLGRTNVDEVSVK